jgi:hypothetical protein
VIVSGGAIINRPFLFYGRHNNRKIIMKIFENRPKLAALGAAILVTGAFAALLGSFSGQAVAASGGNSSNTHMFAVGGFTLTGLDAGGITHMAFAAQQNPQHPLVYAGHVVQETATGYRSGPVQCLSVTVNSTTSSTAAVVWKVTQSNISGDNAGDIRAFQVMDNGNPNMGVSPDMYDDRGLSNDCSTNNMETFEPLVHGNIVVSP